MTKIEMAMGGDPQGPGSDVFAAARWFDEVWNSSAKAVSLEEVEWQCTTWGSGRGCGDWASWATFVVVAAAFGLDSWRNREGRDELVVLVPLARFTEIARMIERLDEDCPEDWPWLYEEDQEEQVRAAAEVLEMSPEVVAENARLLEGLRIA